MHHPEGAAQLLCCPAEQDPHPSSGHCSKTLLGLSSAHQNCTGSHSDLKWNFFSSNLACLTVLLGALAGGFKEVFNPSSCAEVIGTIDSSSSRMVSLSSSTVGPVPPGGRAGRLQHCHGELLRRHLPPLSQAPQWCPAPLPVQSSHSLLRT